MENGFSRRVAIRCSALLDELALMMALWLHAATSASALAQYLIVPLE
jgi:hypothetical protein